MYKKKKSATQSDLCALYNAVIKFSTQYAVSETEIEIETETEIDIEIETVGLLYSSASQVNQFLELPGTYEVRSPPFRSYDG